MNRLLLFGVVILLSILAVSEEAQTAETNGTIKHPSGIRISAKTNLEAYRIQLDRFDLSKFESISIAETELLNKFKKGDSAQAEAALRMFLEFYSKIVESLKIGFLKQLEYQAVLNQTGGLKFAPTKELQKKHLKAIQILQKYKEYGVGFVELEEDAGWDLRANPDYIIRLARQFSGDYSAFVIFYYDESRYSLQMDANLNLTWDELRKKIIRWETFARQHPTVTETNTIIKPEIAYMVSLYLEGTANTPAYDAWIRGTGKIDEDLKKSYAIFIHENKDSQYYALIQRVFDILEKNDFRINKDLVSFVHDKDISAFNNEFIQQFLSKNP